MLFLLTSILTMQNGYEKDQEMDTNNQLRVVKVEPVWSPNSKQEYCLTVAPGWASVELNYGRLYFELLYYLG